MTERVFPDSPFICRACGKDVDGSITIEGKGICADCFKKFGLEDKLGITIERLYRDQREFIGETTIIKLVFEGNHRLSDESIERIPEILNTHFNGGRFSVVRE